MLEVSVESPRQHYIKCPHCGREYLPCEIYYPDEFLGNAKNVVVDNKCIIYFDGQDMNLEEEYVCDDCGKSFRVKAKVSFETTANEYDFDDDYVSELN